MTLKIADALTLIAERAGVASKVGPISILAVTEARPRVEADIVYQEASTKIANHSGPAFAEQECIDGPRRIGVK